MSRAMRHLPSCSPSRYRPTAATAKGTRAADTLGRSVAVRLVRLYSQKVSSIDNTATGTANPNISEASPLGLDAGDCTQAPPLGTGISPSPPRVPRRCLDDVVLVQGLRFERWSNDAGQEQGRDVANNGKEEKTLLLYLPGIDGRGTSIEPQLDTLAQKFDIFRLIVGAEDRSTFLSLSRAVVGFVDACEEAQFDDGGAKLVVVGESFGGMLGLRLAQLR